MSSDDRVHHGHMENCYPGFRRSNHMRPRTACWSLLGGQKFRTWGSCAEAKSQGSQFAHSPAEKADCFRLQSGIIRNRQGIVWFVWEPCQEQGSDVLLGGWMDLGALEQRNESLAMTELIASDIRN